MVFKALFGVEEKKELLAAFLRDMLDLEILSGECLELLNGEIPAEKEDGKAPRLDVRARLKDGEQVNVEI